MTVAEILAVGQPLLFDGAMGTLYAHRWGETESNCEEAAILYPERISSIHRDYADAGCRAVKTDTFAVCDYLAAGKKEYAQRLIHAAVLAARTAADGLILFADMGPAPEASDAAKLRIEAADMFLQEGVNCFLWETLPDDSGVREAAEWLKAQDSQAYLIVSFAAGADGSTRNGASARELIRRTSTLDTVDAVGLNCMAGPGHLLKLIPELATNGKPLSVMPNAGYPTVLGRHVAYQGQPDYFGSVMASICRSGAMILGGCCGTTPAHIAAMVSEVSKLRPETPQDGVPANDARPSAVLRSRLAQMIDAGKKVLAVEVDPPKNDHAEALMEQVRLLSEAGTDCITLADCPVGRPRADSSLLACKLRRETGMEVLPHLTCRDRNLNAIKALLLGLSMEDIHDVLIVTGDPIPTEDRDAVRSVFHFNSRKLAKYVTGLGNECLSQPFTIWGALNVNAANFDIQLKLAKQKEENGITGFLTQPVLSDSAVKNVQKARRELQGRILAGLYPPVSYRNASFLNNEVSGIRVSDELLERYQHADREQGESIGREAALHYAAEVLPYVDGLYLTVPLQRVHFAAALAAELKSMLDRAAVEGNAL